MSTADAEPWATLEIRLRDAGDGDWNAAGERLELYEYLLRVNYQNEALTLSVHDQDIVLSLLIYDRYLNEETGRQMLQNLFQKADHYDDILINDFGATWKIDE